MASRTLSKLHVEVTTSLDENIHRLQELCYEVRRLSDLIPDHNKIEAQKREEKIQQILFDLIEINGTN